MNRIFGAYTKLLDRRPFFVQAVQTGILLGAGDFLSQAFIEKRPWSEYEQDRTMRFSLIGAAMGPSLLIWYKVIEYIVVGRRMKKVKSITEKPKSSRNLKDVMSKVALDQIVFAPISLAVFLSVLNAVQGKSIEEIEKAVKRDYPDILIANYKVWPAVQMLNFALIPLNYRVLFLQTIGLCWNTYLAWRLNKYEKKTEEKEN